MARRAPRRAPHHLAVSNRASLVACGLILLFALLAPTPTYAGVVTVDSLADTSGACPGTGGQCTLRQALTQSSPGDTIQFSVTGTLALTSQLPISKNVSIVGPGADRLTIDAQTGARAFEIAAGVTASMSGLTVTNGRADQGGAIRTYGALTLTRVALTSNSATTLGGAIYNGAGVLAVNESTLAQNAANLGGGILSERGKVTITNSTLERNTATSDSNASGGALHLTLAEASVTGSTFSHNAASLQGGAIMVFTGSSLTVIESSFASNTSALNGGAISSYHSLNVSRSTFETNSSADLGGAINNVTGTAQITNSTLSGNVSGGGGAVRNRAEITITFSTLSGNSNYTIPGPAPTTLHNEDGANLKLRNSILVGRPGDTHCNRPITSLGNNLSDNQTCFRPAANGDIVTDRPVLAPLRAYGGSKTKFHDLLVPSVAIDAVIHEPNDCFGAVDQRGMPRPQIWDGLACDIGAIEGASSTPVMGGIPNLTTTEDTPTPAIPFVVTNGLRSLDRLTFTGSAADDTLVPANGFVFGGSGGFRTVQITPAPNRSGTTSVQVRVYDENGSMSSQMFDLTVTPVEDPPTVTDDRYTITQGQTLTVASAQGVLANDTDAEGSPLTVQRVQTTTHGTLDLSANGAFSYTPRSGFSGVDTFTYRALDGATPSTPATVTITVTSTATPTPTPTPIVPPTPTQTPVVPPTVVTSCSPRPGVVANPNVNGGRLHVRVTSTPLNDQQSNPLQSITFTRLHNARVTVNGQPFREGDRFTAPANVASIEFVVERLAAGQATTVELTVVDGCGSWRTFVGGGAGAGF